jgi:signal transduction histidine kinase
MSATVDSFLTQATVPVIFVDASDAVVEVNPRFGRLTGRNVSEVRGTLLRDLLEPVPSKDKPGDPLYRLIDENGKPMIARIEEICIDEGRLILVLDTADDLSLVSENIHIARLASLGKLLAGIIHEISNPLSVILGCAQLMSMKELPEDLADDVKLILAESMRSSDLVKKVLSFARKADDVQRRFPIQEVIEEASTLKRYSLKNNNIKIVNQGKPASPLTVTGYKAQLTQVLLNLIHNSEHAIRNGDGKGTIGIEAGRTGDKVVVSVSDTGPGIPKTARNRIFDAFYTTKGEDSGTGLGLYISRNIVRKHGGDLVLTDNGTGATIFQVKLPLCREQRSDPRAMTEGLPSL